MFEIYLLCFLLIIILLIVISSLKIGISPMPSSKKANKAIFKEIKNTKNEVIIDLGSGFGSLAIFLASRLPYKTIIGYELSFIPWIISTLLKYILNIKNLHFYRKNFLVQDLSDASLICYLFPKGMEKLEDKLFEENINTKIISNTFAFRNIKARRIIELEDIYKTPIYLYET